MGKDYSRGIQVRVMKGNEIKFCFVCILWLSYSIIVTEEKKYRKGRKIEKEEVKNLDELSFFLIKYEVKDQRIIFSLSHLVWGPEYRFTQILWIYLWNTFYNLLSILYLLHLREKPCPFLLILISFILNIIRSK